MNCQLVAGTPTGTAFQMGMFSVLCFVVYSISFLLCLIQIRNSYIVTGSKSHYDYTNIHKPHEFCIFFIENIKKILGDKINRLFFFIF